MDASPTGLDALHTKTRMACNELMPWWVVLWLRWYNVLSDSLGNQTLSSLFIREQLYSHYR